MGIRQGDHVGVSMSFKSIGRVEGGPKAFLQAFLRVLGPEGTLMVNTFTRTLGFNRLRIDRDDEIFLYSSTPANTGIFAETVRKHPCALRSRHPTCSVAAIGHLAGYLTEGHDHRASAFLPYSRLAEVDGKILAIGIGDRLAGFRHEAQHLAGLSRVVPRKFGSRFIDDKGAVRVFIQEDSTGCSNRLNELVPPMRKNGIVIDGQVGKAKALVVPAKKSLKIMTEKLQLHPEMYLCGDIRCLWCRELERRMDLYRRIRQPVWYQNHALPIAMIAVANWFRLGANPIVYKARQLAEVLDLKFPTIRF